MGNLSQGHSKPLSPKALTQGGRISETERPSKQACCYDGKSPRSKDAVDVFTLFYVRTFKQQMNQLTLRLFMETFSSSLAKKLSEFTSVPEFYLKQVNQESV